jgi:hypothetical protein
MKLRKGEREKGSIGEEEEEEGLFYFLALGEVEDGDIERSVVPANWSSCCALAALALAAFFAFFCKYLLATNPMDPPTMTMVTMVLKGPKVGETEIMRHKLLGQ